MAKSIYHRKGNLKGVLFVIGIILIISGILYTQNLVNVLNEKSTEYLQFKIKLFEESINNPNSNTDVSFLFNEVIQGVDYPVIYTNNQHIPQSWRNISPRLKDKSLSELTPADSALLFETFQEIASENNPIPIQAQDIVLGYYYYGYSPVIYKLRTLPYIAIAAAALFILFGYIGFSYIKRSEQRYIWVGMAKETAHQLGTPLSSLFGWLELLQMDPEIRQTAVKEMKNDINRLNKVANRFSKIGSIPALELMNPGEIIENVVSYFNRRLPNMNKKIQLNTNLNSDLKVNLNPELFEWVLENLIKNSIDAIENKDGKIDIETEIGSDRNSLYIDVSDNGKGIILKRKKDVFRPGYSSKKRGWGLGLSLARRIIEEYHQGKLLLKETKPFSKTTFRIILRP